MGDKDVKRVEDLMLALGSTYIRLYTLICVQYTHFKLSSLQQPEHSLSVPLITH